jgi:hypothetical protein
MLDQRLSAQLKYQRCDNVLRDEGYRTPQAGMRVQYGGNGEMAVNKHRRIFKENIFTAT